MSTHRSKATVPVAAAGTFLALIFFTSPLSNTTILAKELGANSVQITWLLSSTSLALAAFLIVSGTLGDELGRRKVFVTGTAISGLGALICASGHWFSDGQAANVFVLGRFVEGLGAAAMISCTAALIAAGAANTVERTHAMGIWGVALGLGISVGPPFGALMADLGLWWLAYLVMAAAALALCIWASAALNESKADNPKPVDFIGSLLIAASLALLLYGITEAKSGWSSWQVITAVVLAVVLGIAFVSYELHKDQAMLDPRIFKIPGLVGASVAAFVMGAATISLMSYFAVVFTQVYGFSALAAGSTLLLWSLASVCTSLLARKLPASLPGGARFVIGFALNILGCLPSAFLTPQSSLVLPVIGLLVAGIGTGLVNANLGREAVEYLPARQAGMGSGLNNTIRYVGSAIGITIFVALAAPKIIAGRVDTEALTQGWNTAVWFAEALMVLSLVILGLTGALQRRKSHRELSQSHALAN